TRATVSTQVFLGTRITQIERIRQITQVNLNQSAFIRKNRVTEVILPGKQFKNRFLSV
ncbi:MAG: hypothetical protein JWR18_2186, partial [Segetibacter sp.]|nr:hypothetical protein [Segetibacter sp.]